MIPKPEPWDKVKARRKRQEAKVVKDVRQQCVDRDGYCRIANKDMGPCSGPSEWAHLGEKKRFKTRGQAPEVRHTTAGSLMACKAHHDAYDKGTGDDRLVIEALGYIGADGLLRYRRHGIVYEEDRT